MRITKQLFTKQSRPSEISYLETLASQARNSRSHSGRRSLGKHSHRSD